MRKVSISLCYGGWLLASLLVNIFLLVSLIKSGSGKWYTWNNNNNNNFSWAQSAAAEAEAVASVSCSGHGTAYLDGLIDDVHGNPVCECNTCFHGPDCSQFLADCPADADSGDPLFLEPFWKKNAASSAVLLSGWHRMSYTFPGHTFISEELVKHVRKVHAIAKNAVTDGRYILFGDGSTQLLNAAVFALSPEHSSSSPARVVAQVPFYPVYELQTNFFKTDNFEFLGDVSMVKNSSDGTNVIEFVTSPNNPDGFLKKATLTGSSVSSINDYAYYWPHFTAIPAPADEDVMIFSISKLTGHAGTRFGWAIVKDENVYNRMLTYIQMSQLTISKDTQLRALKLLKVVIKDGGKEIFDFGYKTMRDRWNSFNNIMSMSKDFIPQEISTQYCSFFNRVREPSPAYAWLKCERKEHRNCTEVLLRRANIIGRPGRKFNADDRYVRLSLLKNQDDFEQLMYRLKQLVSNEGEGAKVMSKVSEKLYAAVEAIFE